MFGLLPDYFLFAFAASNDIDWLFLGVDLWLYLKGGKMAELHILEEVQRTILQGLDASWWPYVRETRLHDHAPSTPVLGATVEKIVSLLLLRSPEDLAAAVRPGAKLELLLDTWYQLRLCSSDIYFSPSASFSLTPLQGKLCAPPPRRTTAVY